MQVGGRLPDGTFRIKDREGNVKQVPVGDLFAGQKVVLVGVPGAFTSTCHLAHIPTFVTNADAIKARGVDRIAVMAVNDHHVMRAWSDALHADGKIDFLADGSAVFTRAADVVNDQTESGMGIRCKRFAAIVEDGVVTWLAFEPPGGKIVETGAPAVLKQL
jgi:peroxiredoxin